MNRRNFLKSPALAIIAAPAVEAVARLWPFEPIDWITVYDDPSLVGWAAVKDLASCDLCYESATDDFGNGLSYPRQFYRTTDGHGLCVCERCTGDYLAEANQ
jgi:hypothetical protein